MWKRPELEKWRNFFASFGFLILGGVIAISGLFYFLISRNLPNIISIADYQPLGVTQVRTENKGKFEVLGEYYKERRYVVPIEYVPKVVIDAFLSAEDDQFYQHKGISFFAILRASFANFKAGQVVQGGSTITQQVAKSLFLSPERTFIRKLKEAILAYRLENNLTKQQILYLYLNQIYLGHSAHGVQAAARVYFNKDVKDLSVAEAALIAGMPRAPGRYSPFLNPAKAKEVQRYVLKRMFETKAISEEQMVQATSEPLRVFSREEEFKFGEYVLENVRRILVEKYGEKALYEDGLMVTIPSNIEMLLAAKKGMQTGLREVGKRRGYKGPIRQITVEEDLKKFLADSRIQIIRNRVRYEILMPDGHMDLDEAVRIAGYKSTWDLLRDGDIYEGIVQAVDDTNQWARVGLGDLQLTVPLKTMLWARESLPDKKELGPEPKKPSEVLKIGDVVLLKIVPNDLKPEPKTKKRPEPTTDPSIYKEKWMASLEPKPEIQGAIMSLDVHTGELIAMEGGYNFEQSQFNRAIQAKRQPGSSFKPIIFASAIERGYTPVSMIVDAPLVFKQEEGTWKPTNFEEEFYGDTMFRYAFIKSRNIPTIRLVVDQGVQTIINFGKRLGFSADYPSDLSISLGSSATSLEELTKLYAVFPRKGRKVTPIYIRKVVARDGTVLEENKPDTIPHNVGTTIPQEPRDTKLEQAALKLEGMKDGDDESMRDLNPPKAYLPPLPDDRDPAQVLDPRVAFVMTHLMKEVVEYGTGRDAKAVGRIVAGKTGTTNEYKDAWFMGFSPDIVTGVWVGYDDFKDIGSGETGSRAAIPIWNAFMQEAVKRYPMDTDFPAPNGVSFAYIDPETGKLTDEKNPNARSEAFIDGTQPKVRGTDKVSPGSQVESDTEFLKEDL